MSTVAGKSNPLTIIPSIYKSLTKSEQKVAELVMSDTQEAVYSTVTDLSEKAGVGETTVIRFCRKLGFRGFQEFKLAVAQNLANPNEQIHGKIEETDTIEEVAAKITQQNSKVLKDSLELLQNESLQKAVTAIINAKKVYFFGVGSSGTTANDARIRFMRMGLNVDYSSDSHIMAMQASLVGEQDVVVGISSSGSTKDVVDAIQIAKENKAFIICITNHARSPITQYADVILLAASKETPLQGGAFTSKIAQLHLLDILTVIIDRQEKDSSFSAVEKTAKSVLNKMY
ncbi:transcriptional regulator [Oceanobacillus arenosus]|uniref:Transcriptional regulator n=1 Tax=Oceanobacillus arenosus TaxID=1229153 RepID=A0A3D8Q182_9BACI|nr:MurR/RpiR family transcriptional regulator [Oceanobacillus arenosus]RDW22196.1 transcriptional regulator [Oceanobacillus arenosus]